MSAINRRDDWMGLAGLNPTFCHGAEGLEKQCVLANRVVSGYPLDHVLVAFNRWDSEWEMMPPVLIGVNGHWIAIVNTKFDESGIRVCHMVDERGERKQLHFDEDGRLFRQRMQGALAWEKREDSENGAGDRVRQHVR